MDAYVLYILFNELRKRDEMRGLQSIIFILRTAFDKFNNT